MAKATPSLNEAAGEANWKIDTQHPKKILTVSTGTLNAADVIRTVEKVGYKAEKAA